MSYLYRVANRAVRASHPVEPRPRSRFEPPAAGAGPAPLEIDEFVEPPAQRDASIARRWTSPARPTSNPGDERPRGNGLEGDGADRVSRVDPVRRLALDRVGEHAETQAADTQGHEHGARSTVDAPLASSSPIKHSTAAVPASLDEMEAKSEQADRSGTPVDRPREQSSRQNERPLELTAPRRLDAEPAFAVSSLAAVAGQPPEFGGRPTLEEEPASAVAGDGRRQRPVETDVKARRHGGEREPEPDAEPTVTVRIGRIDVRASFPAPAEKRSTHPPIETLDEYLRRTATRR